MVPPPPDEMKPIHIREVWASNLDFEFSLISSIIDEFPFISIDTEFSGVLVKAIDGKAYFEIRDPQNLYRFIKVNVELMKLIQFGVTFTDAEGNLPDLKSPNRHIWQFNFSDFDVTCDRSSPTSIALLTKVGIDFAKNKASGVDSVRFAELMMSSGMVCNESVSWIAYHGNYDFALLLMILTQSTLPDELSDFLVRMKVFFGQQFYDIKYVIRHSNGLFGGLEHIAGLLQIEREVGESHQAGSDSLLAWRVFRKVWSREFMAEGLLEKQAGVLFKLGI